MSTKYAVLCQKLASKDHLTDEELKECVFAKLMKKEGKMSHADIEQFESVTDWSWEPVEREHLAMIRLTNAFYDEEQAALAYDLAAVRFRGEDAATNFPAAGYAAELAARRTATGKAPWDHAE